jgi:hypothetical protein
MSAFRQDIRPFFIGSQATVLVTMNPVVSTSGWTVAMYILTNSGDAIASAVAVISGASVTVGGADGTITISIAKAKTVALAKQNVWYKIVRTDAGAEDVIAYGQFYLGYPRASE